MSTPRTYYISRRIPTMLFSLLLICLATTAACSDHVADGELLISYNVNSFEFQDLFDNADIYKPRFVRVPFFSR